MSENALAFYQPKNLEQCIQLAGMLSKSKIIPQTFQNRPDDLLTAMIWADNLKVPFLQLIQGIAVIQGRPTLYGDVALGVVIASGQLADMKETITHGKDGDIIATCTLVRKDRPTPMTSSFSMRDAEIAGLTKSTPAWQKYPTRMLQRRARSRCMSDMFPDVLKGFGVSEPGDYQGEPAYYMGKAETTSSTPRQLPKQVQTVATPQATKPSVIDATVAQAVAQAENQGREIDASSVDDFIKQIAEAKSRDELATIYKQIPVEIRATLNDKFSVKMQEIRINESAKRNTPDPVEQTPSPEPAQPEPAQQEFADGF